MDADAERAINRAINDALGGVGLTAFDKLEEPLRSMARDRYRERVSARGSESGGHAQSLDPNLRGAP